MHYKNGREAKQGDRVIDLESGDSGIVHSLNGGSTTCNGRLAKTSNGDTYVTLSKCLHADDVKAAQIPDSSAPAPSAPDPSEQAAS